MPTDDVVQLSVIGQALAQQHIHTLHFRFRTGSAADGDLAADWFAGCGTAYRGIFQIADHVIQRIVVRQVCGTGSLRAAYEDTISAANGQGTRTNYTQSMPPWVATVTSERTAIAGKRYQGRFFLGGMSEADQDGGNVDPAHVARVEAYTATLFPLFVNPNSNVDYTLVVWSEKLRSLPGSSCLSSSTSVSNFLTRTALATMKSRKVGSGS